MMKGKDITNCYSIGSMYDNNSIIVLNGDKHYRLKCNEILKIIKNYEFTEKKARTNTYLEVVINAK